MYWIQEAGSWKIAFGSLRGKFPQLCHFFESQYHMPYNACQHSTLKPSAIPMYPPAVAVCIYSNFTTAMLLNFANTSALLTYSSQTHINKQNTKILASIYSRRILRALVGFAWDIVSI